MSEYVPFIIFAGVCIVVVAIVATGIGWVVGKVWKDMDDAPTAVGCGVLFVLGLLLALLFALVRFVKWAWEF